MECRHKTVAVEKSVTRDEVVSVLQRYFSGRTTGRILEYHPAVPGTLFAYHWMGPPVKAAYKPFASIIVYGVWSAEARQPVIVAYYLNRERERSFNFLDRSLSQFCSAHPHFSRSTGVLISWVRSDDEISSFLERFWRPKNVPIPSQLIYKARGNTLTSLLKTTSPIRLMYDRKLVEQQEATLPASDKHPVHAGSLTIAMQRFVAEVTEFCRTESYSPWY